MVDAKETRAQEDGDASWMIRLAFVVKTKAVIR
jgi:hypothetical protein